MLVEVFYYKVQKSKKMCDLGENGEGDVNFEKVKKQSRCTSLSLGSLAEGV